MKNSGFTLIELIVTIAVAIILATVAVPSFQTIIKNNKLATTTNDLLSGFGLAQSEAIKRGVLTGVCPTTNYDTCATGTSWDSGWLIFADNDGDGVRDAGETLINVMQRDDNLTIRKAVAGAVQYQNTGGLAPGVNYVLNVCDDRGADYARRLSLAGSGRPKVCHGTKSSGDNKCPVASPPVCP